MYSFFVLGLVPGTNIQITFVLWLEVAAGVIVIIGLIRLLRALGLTNRVSVHGEALQLVAPASHLHHR